MHRKIISHFVILQLRNTAFTYLQHENCYFLPFAFRPFCNVAVAVWTEKSGKSTERNIGDNNSGVSSSPCLPRKGGNSEKKTTFGSPANVLQHGAKSTVSQEFHPASRSRWTRKEKIRCWCLEQLGALCNNSILTYALKRSVSADRPADPVGGCVFKWSSLSTVCVVSRTLNIRLHIL